MAIPKLVLAFVIVVSMTSTRPIFSGADCDGFEFKTEITKAPNQELFKLTITASGGSKPYHYVLIDSKNKLVSNDFETREFDKLKQGRYRCIVADKNDCTKEEYIEVK